MKCSYLIALVVLIVLSCRNNNRIVDRLNIPKLSWTDTVLELGSIKRDTSYKFSFVYSIDGSSDLKFEKIETSCGCTVVELQDTGKFVLGKKYHLDGELNTHELKGEVDKAIYILTNGEPQFSLLKIQGYVQ